MAQRPNKKTLGPRFQLQVPYYGFEEADRDLRKYQEIMDDNQRYFFENNVLSDGSKVPSGKIKKRQLKPLYQSGGDQRLEFNESREIINNSQVGMKGKLESSALFSEGGEGNNIRASPSMKLEKLDNGSWINENLKNKPKNIPIRPGRDENRIEAYQKHIGSDKKQDVNFKGNKSLHDEEGKGAGAGGSQDEDGNGGLSTAAEREFAEKGKASNKNLKNYDCWDEEISPKQWIENYRGKKGPHGRSPIFKNSQYQWADVNLLDYDVDSDKFLVEICESGQKKWVIRLSLMFNDENPEKFIERVELSKQRQKNADDELRFYQYVDHLRAAQENPNIISSLNENWKREVFNKVVNTPVHFARDQTAVFFSLKEKSKQEKKEREQRLKRIKQLKQMGCQSIIPQVEQEYRLFMKKCIVLQEMKDGKNKEKWMQLRIRNRWEPKSWVYLGTIFIPETAYTFEPTREQIKQIHFYSNPQVYTANMAFKKREYESQKYKLFKTEFLKTDLPISLGTFESIQKNHHMNARATIMKQMREFIISEIMDTLKGFQFYQTEKEDYEKRDPQRLKQLLIRFDMMMNTYVRDMLVKRTVDDYCLFLRNFNVPKENEANLWLINDHPLLVINLIVNQNFKKKRDKKKDEKTRKKEEAVNQANKKLNVENPKAGDDEDESDEPIYYDPGFQNIRNVMQKPMEMLVQTVNSFYKLEKDMVPMIDLPLQSSFKIELKRGGDSDNPNARDIIQGLSRIAASLNEGFEEPEEILNAFRKYSFLIEKTTNSVVKSLFKDSKNVNILDLKAEDIKDRLYEYVKARQEIERLCLDERKGRFFQIRTKDAKTILMKKAEEFIDALIQKIQLICEENIKRIGEEYNKMEKDLRDIPKNENQLVKLQNQIKENESDLARMAAQVDAVYQFMLIMETYLHQFSEQNTWNFWDLKTQPSIIKESVSDGLRMSNEQKEKFIVDLDNQKNQFAQEMEFLRNQLKDIQGFTEYENKVNQNGRRSGQLEGRIQDAWSKIESFHSRELIFYGSQQADFDDDLRNLAAEFEPYNQLWNQALEFDMDLERWMQGSFVKNSAKEIESRVRDEYIRELTKLTNVFQNERMDEKAANIGKEFRAKIDEFKKNQWLFDFLTNEAMSNLKKSLPHWKEIFKECNFPQEFEPSEDMNLKQLLEYQIDENKDLIETISKRADGQFQIEKKLKEIEDKMKEQKLTIVPHKKSGSYMLMSLDEVTQVLDDQLNLMMMLKASPFMKTVQKQATALESKIILIQDTLENWIKCQRSWMYLEPIFASEDIKKKMQLEKQKFDGVDKNWRSTMEIFVKDPGIFDNIDGDKYKNEFHQNNKTLDVIQKSLSEYLETKRRSFPRFYFLSDEELLEILAQTKDPLLVNQHINKCFEAINLLEFNPNQEVLAMISAEKERVALNRSINVNEGDKKGNVEKWLLDIESVMIETLKKITKESLLDQRTLRTKWILKWPGQVVLAVNMMRWTKGAEIAIINGNAGGPVEVSGGDGSHPAEVSANLEASKYNFPNLKAYESFLNLQLKDVVELVRQELSDLERLTLGALVVLDVHARDTVTDLQLNRCENVNEFMWISQLRYYWSQEKREQILWVKMINAMLKYGFEYLGNSMRLVITPLTDRCYRTLMGAFHLNYGGAPEGPAGTGKTETTKDLAKAMAVQCVVFNCSDGLNYLAMRKFFKGLASSGAWCCFDEFNRIDLEVLSVIAQQVLTIQTAIRERKRIFLFDGEDITLIPSCAINITMNPGYAGRSDLPDNLKALFRPCAMMVPDYALIAEIYLYSVGFQEARHLAKKIVASLRLSSEQLSSQYHYDFGMRALKAALTASGNLKRVMTDSEDVVCLRALNDVNIPKFTINDVPLFQSITSDLFPSTQLPVIDYGNLLTSLNKAIADDVLQPEENYIKKCIQLFDTINVRHGLMVVGEAFSGQSKVFQTLANSISAQAGAKGFHKVAMYKLNPKSITSDQLYGKLDPDTKQWSDGVIAIIMRECSKDVDLPERKWIIFDGPVDAVWIENMNTVLDDNKKLCLTSGEIIKMTPLMTMMFEVEDLSVASPATVSRCGMVFMEPKQLGWEPLVKSYVMSLPHLLEKYADHFYTVLQWVIDGLLNYAMRHGKFYVHHSDMTFVANCLKLMKAYMAEYDLENAKVPQEFQNIIDNYALFCSIWSIGSALEETTRKGFSDFVVKLVAGSNDDLLKSVQVEYTYPFEPRVIQTKWPDKVNVFEMIFDKARWWINWTQTVEKYIVPKGGEFHNIFVPTIDSIRNTYFLHKCVENQIHIMFSGPTGTGKTLTIVSELSKRYFNAEYTNLCTSFSGQTKVNLLQRQIESKVNTRRRKGYYGPEEGRKYIVIFIDDLNMPAKEVYGAQPPIELLRQWMDNMGWYDLDTKEWKYLQDIIFVAAMLPPTGGRNTVSLRYMRHFNLMYVEPFENDSLFRIFTNVLEWYFINQTQPVSKAITNLRDNIVNSTIQIYNKVQNSKELLPTPAQSHYTYNLRDISKVFQGISKAIFKSYKDENDFIKLWAHEIMRVFQDRLINEQDQDFFEGLMKTIIYSNFKRDWTSLVEVQPLLFANFVPTLYPDGDTSKPMINGIYCELTNVQSMKNTCNKQLHEYNDTYSTNRMNLVLFMSAIQHVIKIVRVITTAFGHCLLVGVGGSGRKSLATLASYIAFTAEPSQVDSKNWVEDLQNLMKAAGLDGKEVIFLFSDTQILNESLVEDVCNILNNGEIPNLFPADEKAKIVEEMGPQVQGSSNEKFNFFVQTCQKNLHLVLAFSPVGEAFRRRLRTFPSLVNCTTIDWFLPWPEDALRNTAANHFMNEMKVTDEQLRAGLVEIAVDMQMRVSQLSKRYFDELRRYYYVTPTSYLELLSTFQRQVTDRTKNIYSQITQYETGNLKITATEKDVDVMKKELEEMQPQLVIATEDNQQMLADLNIQQKEADVKLEICQADEKVCNGQREVANNLAQNCQRELDKVTPILENASALLEKIEKKDIDTLKSFTKPPASAAIVMEGICYAFNEDQEAKVKSSDDAATRTTQFWDYAKKSLLNDKLIKRVKGFQTEDIDGIPQNQFDKLKGFLDHPLFEKDKVFNASSAAGNLSLWVRAVVEVREALKIVKPQQEMLGKAKSELEAAEKTLAVKKKALNDVLSLLQGLKDSYEKAKAEKDDLEFRVNKCKVQLDRAEKLISGLSGQKQNWIEKAKQFRLETNTIIGDCLLSSGIIAYLGAFPIAYRDETISEWMKLLGVQKIDYSLNYQFSEILCDLITIGQWTNIQKLPNDSFSIDNAIILKNSNRWPLMIDPQEQANKWIKAMEGTKLKILRLSQTFNQLSMTIEAAIQYGIPVLLENIGETIDSVFEPVLQKKISKGQIQFGEKNLDYNTDFKFYVTTKYPRPHYSPEICVQVTLLNFQITQEGLEEQMLGTVIKKEEPTRDQLREKNIKDFFENKEAQRNTENLILKLLNESQGNLLDDEFLIQTLQKSNKESIEIEQKIKAQEAFKESFNVIRNNFKQVAKRVSHLYFVILDLALIEPSYQWSLEYYVKIFESGILQAIPGKENRRDNIVNQFQQLLYEATCRSLLEKDKLIFSLLLCLKILESEKQISSIEIRFLMVGGTLSEPPRPKPEGHDKWLSDKAWCTICEMSTVLKNLEGFSTEFEKNILQWEAISNQAAPQDADFPGQWNEKQQRFSQLIIIRVLFLDQFAVAAQNLICKEMDEFFIQPPPFNLEEYFQDSSNIVPMIFVLSPGADPRQEIIKLANKKGIASFPQISLGQGQGDFAKAGIEQAMQEGKWVLLQNCHLAPSFMPILDRIIEINYDKPESFNRDFRMWLTSMPSEVFPATILMKGVKVTYEPPRGLRNNLIRSFATQDKKTFEDCVQPNQWQKLFFGLAFFHALILERRKYGPLGWNIPYEFTAPDFIISFSQLQMFLNEYQDIPYEALNYMVAEANYGGRVTDPKDRRLISILLQMFYTPKILDEDYQFSQDSDVYFAPQPGDLQSYQQYINSLPINDLTTVFGLHSNAEISSAILETEQICDTILNLLPRTAGGSGQSAEEIIKEKVQVLMSKLPKLFDLQAASQKHQIIYENSMNTVLQQELIRFNKLLNTVKSSLKNLDLAIDGLLVMSSDLETVFKGVFDNRVPDLWHKAAYPSLKPLGSWINDFVDRLNFMQKWVDEGSPPSFWISGFYFTQSFLTGVMQNFARKYKIAIDTLSYTFQMVPVDGSKFNTSVAPEDGCYIYGLFFDGGQWNEDKKYLDESDPKVLYNQLPYVYLVPSEEKHDWNADVTVYEIPVYKTSRRAGVLSTTGHSTNFVISMYLPIAPHHLPEHWVKRGLAALTQLND